MCDQHVYRERLRKSDTYYRVLQKELQFAQLHRSGVKFCFYVIQMFISARKNRVMGKRAQT